MSLVEPGCFQPGEVGRERDGSVLPEARITKLVTLLRGGKIQLEKKLQLEIQPDKPPAPSLPAKFDSSDEWLIWLQTSIYAVSLFATFTADAENIQGFKLELHPFGSSKPLNFTTDAFPAALGLILSSDGTVSGLPTPTPSDALTYLPTNGETLILGLALESLGQDVKLSDVVEFAGLDHLAKGLSFLDTIDLTLDNQFQSAADGSQSHRNAIWFEHGDSYKTVIRLQFTVPLGKISTFFTKYLLMKNKTGSASNKFGPFDAAYLVVKKTMREMRWQSDRKRFSMEVSVALAAKCTIQLEADASIHFSVALTFNPGSVDFDLVPGPESLDNVVNWLADTAGIKKFNTQKKTMMDALGIASINLNRISLTFATDKPRLIFLRLELGAELKGVMLLFSYTWSGGGGKLRVELSPTSQMFSLAQARRLWPGWEEYHVSNKPSTGKLGLTSLFEDAGTPHTNPSPELGGHMSHLALEVSGSEINLYGRLNLQKPPSSDSGPHFSFDSVTFSGRYKWEAPKTLDVSFTVCCSLQGDPPEERAYMTGEVEYRDQKWTLTVLIENLSISALGRFLGDSSESRDIMDFIGKLQIVSLKITYTFPKTFFSKGTLRLGDFELKLTFEHHEDGKCNFDATLDPTDKQSTIGKVLDSITGSTSSLNLPSFVTDMKLEGDGKSAMAAVKFLKDDHGLSFAVSFHIGPLKFTFVQYRSATAGAMMKRVIKVSAELPSFKIPMIDNPVQPFGELYFMWVDAPTKGSAPAGLTAGEVDTINGWLKDPEFLMFKKTTNVENVSVIAAGLHFVLIGEETRTVTIDYVFQVHKESNTLVEEEVGKGKGKEKEEKEEEEKEEEEEEGTEEQPNHQNTTVDKTPGETQMAVYKKSIGPLSISNIGLLYKDNVLAVHLDAELLLGPVGVSLLGLTVGLTLDGNLQKFPVNKIEVSLDGMAVSYDKSPVTIAGLFKHTKTAKTESYGGGIIVGFDPYRFEAAGIYTTTNEFKSVFVFAKLEGPLVVLEFAEISGITGGFGYNIHLKIPRVTEVLDFPFLGGMGSDQQSPQSPQSVLDKIGKSGYFTPSEGSSWVAAGLKVKAFQALTINAVVVVQWDPYVSLAIVGMAVVDVPKLESKVKLLHIELGFAATVDFRSGVMKFEGQLTQNSYIFSHDCRLTGGFAIYYWFAAADPTAADRSLEGDWVVTIGGYHRQFNPPAHYPKPPPRLGISWKVSESISVSGEAYFAITPKVCMGGVRLHATLSLGALEAYFDAHADFLINFDPFHFVADIGIVVAVKYTLDLWFVTTNISVELDAELHLEGPPFSGTVHVDFYIVAFSIDFGPGATKPEKADLERFYQLVIQDDAKGSAGGGDGHLLGCLAGMIADEPSSEKAQKKWKVRAGEFSFRISCRFPIDDATGPNFDSCKPLNPKPIFAKPMELVDPLSSTMTVEIKKVGAGSDSVRRKWKATPVVKNVPSALWGKYDSSTDPMNNDHKPASILKTDNPTIPLTMGITISAPGPYHPEDHILPFNPAEQKPTIAFPRDRCPKFPITSEANTEWQPEPDEDLAVEIAAEIAAQIKRGIAVRIAARVAEKIRWSRVSEKWRDSTENESTVNLWSKAFSWKVTPKGKAPDQLIKDFGNLYMVPPVLTMGRKCAGG